MATCDGDAGDIDRYPFGNVEHTIQLGGIDEGDVLARADNRKMIGDVEVTGERSILASAGQRECVRSRFQQDGVGSGKHVGFHDGSPQCAVA